LWQGIVSHKRITETLGRAIDSGKVGHAYLFVGPKGVGKGTVAQAFARGIVASSEPLPHPDVTEIQTDTQNVLIEHTRELTQNALLTPLVAERKVFIVHKADKLTPQAANSLLQVLEEPPPSVVVILLANTPHVLLTIRSRCQVLSFSALDEAETLTVLERVGPVSPDKARIIQAARLSFGSPGEALRLLDEGGRVLCALEEWVEGYLGFTLAERISYLVKLEKEPEALYDYVYYLAIWMRDLIYCKLGLERHVAWASMGKLEEQSVSYDLGELQAKLIALYGLLVQWGPGISKRLVLDQLLVVSK